ncbi:MAG: phosphotransferase [Acidimicrobiales bacterium]
MLTGTPSTRLGPDPDLAQLPSLAPDDLLPWRDELLDATAVVDRARRLGLVDGPVSGASLVRAKYRIGESLRVAWRLDRTPAPPLLISVRSYARGTGPANLGPAAGPDGRRRGAGDPDWRAGWWVFPHDRRLRLASRLMAADPGLAGRLGLNGWLRSEVAEYAPERSLTVRAVGADGAPLGYVKCYAPGTFDTDRLAGRYELVNRWFARRPGLTTPEVLGSAPDLLALEALAGTPWADDAAGAADHHLHLMGQAVAHLHQLPVAATTGLCRPFTRLRADRVAGSAQLVARARPDVASAVGGLARRLTARPAAGEVVLLHGDCHPGNTLLGPGPAAISLIDLDQSGIGEPACDIASMLARIQLGALVGEHDRSRATALSEAFLEGYRQRRNLPGPAQIRWYLAATLLVERAVRAVNRLHAGGLAQLPALVDLATAVLDGGLFTDRQLERRP